MSSGVLKMLAIVMVIFALLAAAVAYRVGQNYSRQARAAVAAQQTAEAETPKTLAVVAARPILAFEPIARDDLAVVPVEIAPETVFASVEDVEGRVSMLDIDAGTPLTSRYFREQSQLSRIIPDGHKALSLEINDVIAVGGFLRPGDVVDLQLFVRGSGSNSSNQARTLLEAVSVLGFDDRIIDRPEGAEPPTGTTSATRRRVRTAVLAIPDAQVNRVLLGDSVGDIRLALNGAEPDAQDAPADGGLPLLAGQGDPGATPAGGTPDQAAITQAELLEIARKQDGPKPPPPPPPVYVYRGDDVQAVRP